MARNGSGTYVKVGGDAVFDTVISESYYNSQVDDMVTALTGSIAANGETPITANLPMNSKKLTGMAVGSALTDSVTLGQAQAQAMTYVASDTGSANTYVIAPSPAVTALAAGMEFWFPANAASTGASTLAVSGLATKAIESKGVALTTEIGTSGLTGVKYDGTAFQLISAVNTSSGVSLGLVIALT